MKILLTILTLASFSFSSIGQIVFWTETFDGSACPTSGCDPSIVSWNVVSLGGEGANANRFYVSDQESGNAPPACGSAGTGDQSLHVGNVSTSAAAALLCPAGDCGAAYDASGAGEVTNKRAESPTIDCSGKTGIIVDFNYLENGDAALDDCSFWYNDGTTWSNINPIAKSGMCALQGRWTAITSISLPVSADNNPNVRIGFRWVNNGDGSGSDPSFAVDDITVSYTVSLPVELLYFNGQMQEKEVHLEWVTETEINNDFFTIERSENGINFSPISEIPGSGNSNSSRYYSTIDYSPPTKNTIYYRLKQTDFNGEFSYSKTVSINNSSLGYDIVHFNHNLSINSNNDEIGTIKILDITGKEVYSNKMLSNHQISTNAFNSGIYIIKIKTSSGVIIRKMKF